MSTYLTIGLVPKESDVPMDVISFVSGSDIYESVADYRSIPYYLDETPVQDRYAELKERDFIDMIEERNSEIKRLEKRIAVSKQVVGKDSIEVIDDIVQVEEYKEQLEHCVNDLKFLKAIAVAVENDFTDFCKLVCYLQ